MPKKTAVKKKKARKRLPDRVILDVRPSRSRTPFEAADYITAAWSAITALSQRVTEAWVSGISGHCWRVIFSSPTALVPETPQVGSRHLTLRALRLMGAAPAVKKAQDPQETVREIIESIRDERPVLAQGLHRKGRWGLIVGFNRRRHRLYYTDVHDRDEPVEIADSALESRNMRELIFVRGDGEKPTRREMFHQSLQLAVDWARSGLQKLEPGVSTIHYSGYTAWQHWITLLRGPVPRLATRQEARTHARIVLETAYARTLAPDFLSEGTRYVSDKDAEILQAAIEAFREVAERLASLVEIFPVDPPALKRAGEGAEILAQAFAAERVALGHIQHLLRSEAAAPSA
jgi:hypothetical protein